jgi:hypothetical protein
MLTKYSIKSSILFIENIFFAKIFFRLPNYFFQYHFGVLRITWTRNFLFSSNADSRVLAPNLITITNFFVVAMRMLQVHKNENFLTPIFGFIVRSLVIVTVGLLLQKGSCNRRAPSKMSVV